MPKTFRFPADYAGFSQKKPFDNRKPLEKARSAPFNGLSPVLQSYS